MNAKIMLCIFLLSSSFAHSGALPLGTIIPDEELVRENGIAYYQGEPFSGRSIERDHGPGVFSSGVSVISWVNGSKNGLATMYYDEGRTQLFAEVNLINGLSNGRQIGWFRNGKVHEITYYRFGLKDGPSTTYYDNGVKSFEGVYVNDELHGVAKLWDRNGKLVYHLEYHLGEVIYTIKEMDPNYNKETHLIEEPKTEDAAEEAQPQGASVLEVNTQASQ